MLELTSLAEFPAVDILDEVLLDSLLRAATAAVDTEYVNFFTLFISQLVKDLISW